MKIRAPNDDGKYQCSCCLKWKVPSSYHYSARAATKLRSFCKACAKVKIKQVNLSDAAKKNKAAYAKKWRKENPRRVRVYHAEYYRRWALKQRQKAMAEVQEMTNEEYTKKMLEAGIRMIVPPQEEVAKMSPEEYIKKMLEAGVRLSTLPQSPQ